MIGTEMIPGVVKDQLGRKPDSVLSNHFHLLLRTGATPISMVLRRVLTGYAIGYNLRHHRHGNLFQNRF